MTKETYRRIENYMLSCMEDSAHDEEHIYRVLPDGTISDGSQEEAPSFFREYKYKLEKLYDRFYTRKGAGLGS